MVKLRVVLASLILFIIVGMWWFSPKQFVPSAFFQVDHQKTVNDLLAEHHFTIQGSGGHSITPRYALKPLSWQLTPGEVLAEKLLPTTDSFRVDIASLTLLDAFRFSFVASMGERFERELRQEGLTVQIDSNSRGQKCLFYHNDRLRGMVRFTSSLNADRSLNLDLFIYEH